MAEPIERAIPSLARVEGRKLSLPRFVAPGLAWEYPALVGILLLATILNVIQLAQERYGNTYYAAAVRSMLQSWHNFFFVAFDPGGFLAVDKPPLGLWIQTLSARLFGFSGLSLLLPQAMAGILSVALLYHLVARTFGSSAGLLAALVLALTPIAVIDNRNNTPDSLLILVLLLAAWAVLLAVERGRLRWLVLGAVFVGLAFNIKELQAYLILPALMLAYLVGAPLRLPTRLRHLLVAGVVLLVISFCWIIAVDLTPTAQRPYVTDSGTNSELSLALGYNGFGRLTAGLLSHLSIPFLHVKLDFAIVPAISAEIGNPGLLRLFNPAIAEQVSWLLPLALVGLVAAFWTVQPRRPLGQERPALVLWGGWLLTVGIFFSVARFYHLYYLTMLAPAIAALAGIGMVGLWNDYRRSMHRGRSWWMGWALPLTVLVTALVQVHTLAAFGGTAGWPTWLAPLVAAVGALVAAALLAGRLGVRFQVASDMVIGFGVRSALALALAGTLSLLVAPASWAAVSVASGNGGAWLPQAGPNRGFGGGFGPFGAGPGGRFRGGTPGGFPRSAAGPSFTPPKNGSFGTSRFGRFRRAGGPPAGFGGGAGGAITFAGSSTPTLDPKLVHYLETHQGTARYLVATMTSSYASLLIIETGRPVMTLGGYQGWDKIVTASQLSRLVAKGTVRYFLLPATRIASTGRGLGRFGGAFGSAALPRGVDANLSTVNTDLVTWVHTHCTAVPTSDYQRSSQAGSPGSTIGGGSFRGFDAGGAGQLYACYPNTG